MSEATTGGRHRAILSASDAAEDLFRAELALEDARETGYDPWIAAAYERLHEAIAEHLRASADHATPA